jgi:hypothetical protein
MEDGQQYQARSAGYAKRMTIAFSVDVARRVVAIHGVFFTGQDFAPLLRDAAR